jgi:hypothetical protein
MHEDDKGAIAGMVGEGALVAQQLTVTGIKEAPLLHTESEYATWKKDMHVFLEQHGAAGVHCIPVTEQEWSAQAARVHQWKEEAITAALVLCGIDSSCNSSNSMAASRLSDKEAAARGRTSTAVSRSKWVFGEIYFALPQQLRRYAAHIPQGWAFGLWNWLEKALQTEAESQSKPQKRRKSRWASTQQLRLNVSDDVVDVPLCAVRTDTDTHIPSADAHMGECADVNTGTITTQESVEEIGSIDVAVHSSCVDIGSITVDASGASLAQGGDAQLALPPDNSSAWASAHHSCGSATDMDNASADAKDFGGGCKSVVTAIADESAGVQQTLTVTLEDCTRDIDHAASEALLRGSDKRSTSTDIVFDRGWSKKTACELEPQFVDVATNGDTLPVEQRGDSMGRNDELISDSLEHINVSISTLCIEEHCVASIAQHQVRLERMMCKEQQRQDIVPMRTAEATSAMESGLLVALSAVASISSPGEFSDGGGTAAGGVETNSSSGTSAERGATLGEFPLTHGKELCNTDGQPDPGGIVSGGTVTKLSSELHCSDDPQVLYLGSSSTTEGEWMDSSGSPATVSARLSDATAEMDSSGSPAVIDATAELSTIHTLRIQGAADVQLLDSGSSTEEEWIDTSGSSAVSDAIAELATIHTLVMNQGAACRQAVPAHIDSGNQYFSATECSLSRLLMEMRGNIRHSSASVVRNGEAGAMHSDGSSTTSSLEAGDSATCMMIAGCCCVRRITSALYSDGERTPTIQNNGTRVSVQGGDADSDTAHAFMVSSDVELGVLQVNGVDDGVVNGVDNGVEHELTTTLLINAGRPPDHLTAGLIFGGCNAFAVANSLGDSDAPTNLCVAAAADWANSERDWKSIAGGGLTVVDSFNLATNDVSAMAVLRSNSGGHTGYISLSHDEATVNVSHVSEGETENAIATVVWDVPELHIQPEDTGWISGDTRMEFDMCCGTDTMEWLDWNFGTTSCSVTENGFATQVTEQMEMYAPTVVCDQRSCNDIGPHETETTRDASNSTQCRLNMLNDSNRIAVRSDGEVCSSTGIAVNGVYMVYNATDLCTLSLCEGGDISSYTIAVSQNGMRSDRTKHVDVKYHFVTEAVDNEVVKLVWVLTTQQQADIFTMALATVFELLRSKLMTR